MITNEKHLITRGNLKWVDATHFKVRIKRMIAKKYETMVLGKEIKRIIIICDCDNSETLNTFLNSELRPFEEEIKSEFDQVLSGQKEFGSFGGNVCCVEINPETTIVYDSLAEDEEYDSTSCKVNTKEIRNVIEEWCDKIREFKKKCQSEEKKC